MPSSKSKNARDDSSERLSSKQRSKPHKKSSDRHRDKESRQRLADANSYLSSSSPSKRGSGSDNEQPTRSRGGYNRESSPKEEETLSPRKRRSSLSTEEVRRRRRRRRRSDDDDTPKEHRRESSRDDSRSPPPRHRGSRRHNKSSKHRASSSKYSRDRRSRSESPISPKDTRKRSKSPSLTTPQSRKSTVKETVKAAPVKRSKWDVAVMPTLDPDDAKLFENVVTSTVENRRGRRAYIGNLPPGVTEAQILQFFNGALLGAAKMNYATAASMGKLPAVKTEYFSDHRYCFLEFQTVQDAATAMKLDGISFNGYNLKIGKPNDYTTTSGSHNQAAHESAAFRARKPVPEQKVYVTDLPPSLTDVELRKLCETYGPVLSTAIMNDLRTGQSMGSGIVEFADPSYAEACVKSLNGKPMNGYTPRFTQGPLVPNAASNAGDAARSGALQTSNIVTELPTSMTHKIFTNALIGAQVQAARKQGSVWTPVVQLLNCVYPEDLIKDDEYQAIVDDIKKEVSVYGTIHDVVIPRPPENLAFKPGVGKVFIHFADITAARKAQAELNGRKYEERRVICAAFYPEDRFLSGNYTII